MEIDPAQLLWPAAAAIALSLGIGTAVVVRIRAGLPVVPYRPRRRVPWGLAELLVVLVAGQVLGLCAAKADRRWFAHPPAAAVAADRPEQLGRAHPLLVLLQADRGAGTLLLVCVCAVVVAPIAEEFFFRVLLQGWLEAKEGRLRRRSDAVRRLLPGTLPVLGTSLLFGSVHYRLFPAPTDPDVLAHMIASQIAAQVATCVFAVWLVRNWSGATAADLGFVPEKLVADVGLGLAAFGAVAAPIYLLQLLLIKLLPGNPINDPITLTFFALALGTLYYRTHRIVPSIVLHMALNATSVAMAWVFLAG